jgi:hypothetical protein
MTGNAKGAYMTRAGIKLSLSYVVNIKHYAPDLSGAPCMPARLRASSRPFIPIQPRTTARTLAKYSSATNCAGNSFINVVNA